MISKSAHIIWTLIMQGILTSTGQLQGMCLLCRGTDELALYSIVYCDFVDERS